MQRVSRRFGISLYAIALSSALAFVPVNAGAQGWSPSMNVSKKQLSSRLPSNYRLLMAKYIKANFAYRVIDAKITPVYERWGGLFRGGSYACVCVVVLYYNEIFGRSAQALVLTMDKGRVTHLAKGTESCLPLGPFPELVRR